MMRTTRFTMLASALALSLAACSYDPVDEDGTEAAGSTTEAGTETVSAMIASADGLDGVKDVMNDVGLAEAFDGNAPYTVFAPTDEALGELGPDFEGEEARPALLAILREHIVPGYLTTEDIGAAIDRAGGSVEMQTMGETTLSFTKEGDDIRVQVTGADPATILPAGMRGANGVVYPIDAVLKDFDPEG